MLSIYKCDEITRKLSEKYNRSYSEIWDEITELLTDYAHVIEDKAESDGIPLHEVETSVIYHHFKITYGDM